MILFLIYNNVHFLQIKASESITVCLQIDINIIFVASIKEPIEMISLDANSHESFVILKKLYKEHKIKLYYWK